MTISDDDLAVHMFDVTHRHSNNRHGSLQVLTVRPAKSTVDSWDRQDCLPLSERMSMHISAARGWSLKTRAGDFRVACPAKLHLFSRGTASLSMILTTCKCHFTCMSDATMHHYCRQLATSCFEPALCRTTKESRNPTRDHFKLLFEASNSGVFFVCAHNNFSTCEQHNRTHQACHLQ